MPSEDSDSTVNKVGPNFRQGTLWPVTPVQSASLRVWMARAPCLTFFDDHCLSIHRIGRLARRNTPFTDLRCRNPGPTRKDASPISPQCLPRTADNSRDTSTIPQRREDGMPGCQCQDLHFHSPPIGVMARTLHRPDEEDGEGKAKSGNWRLHEGNNSDDRGLRPAHDRPSQDNHRRTTQTCRVYHQAATPWTEVSVIHEGEL